MELEGVVHNGVIVPDDATALPEGTRVRITPASLEKPRPFGERFAQYVFGFRVPADGKQRLTLPVLGNALSTHKWAAQISPRGRCICLVHCGASYPKPDGDLLRLGQLWLRVL